MAATTSQVLFAEASCFCAVTAEAYETMKLAMLSSIVQTLGITMTIPELMDYGKCYGCLGLSTAQTAELALLDLISQNITTGGSGGPGMVGVVDPEGVVTADPGTAYSNRILKTFWYKETGVGSVGWTQYI